MPKPDIIYTDNTWLSIIADGLTPVDKTSFSTGSKNSIGTTAVQMSSTSYAVRRGVLIKASNVNVGRVYVGDDNTVTQNTNASTDGFELGPGQEVIIPVTNVNVIYLVASQAGQKVFWMAI